ncbi:MAG: peptidoglycan bridge formation glycyltransferase FemA/FemB family protein [Anaerolineae bacterium]|nr:peptidoglycan bridge formation glycyltransferase FemA/FemB family protein [Anaerolineae bacterium]
MIKITDEAIWDAALLELPAAHILQSWTWGALKSRHGWRAIRYFWRDGSRSLAAAQVLVQKRGRLCLGYVPKGPILDWSNLPLVDRVLNNLEVFARQEGLLLLKLDPDVRTDTRSGQAVLQLLQQRKWRASFEQIQFRNTMMLDLTPDLDQLMEGMKPKWRYNVRLAVRKGVTVRAVGEEHFPLFYRLYAETARRDNFIIREEPYYLDVWQHFARAGQLVPLLAEVEDEPVAMLMLFHFGQYAWYLYGASRSLHREFMPNHLLQWEAIRKAKELGCTAYDLWGAPDTLDDEQDGMWGVYRFKVGFGAEFVPHIGAYDYAPNPLLYRIYAFLRPRLVELAQRRYWTQMANQRVSE